MSQKLSDTNTNYTDKIRLMIIIRENLIFNQISRMLKDNI